MKVSIITACYNRKDTIACAIESVLAQDYADIEYIVVDGASTDGSIDIINQYKDRISTIICELDRGMYEAINKGIRASIGDVIALLHSDDVMYNDSVVSRVVAEMEKTDAEFLYADGVFVSSKNIDKVIRIWRGGKYSTKKVFHGWLPLHTTCYVRRSVIEQKGMYDESYKIAADTDFLIRCLKYGDLKVFYLPEIVVKMRMGGLSTDIKRMKQMAQEDLKIYRTYGMRGKVTKLEKMMWKVPQFVNAFVRRVFKIKKK